MSRNCNIAEWEIITLTLCYSVCWVRTPMPNIFLIKPPPSQISVQKGQLNVGIFAGIMNNEFRSYCTFLIAH